MKKHKLLFSILAAFLVTLVATVTTYTSASFTFPITQLGTGQIGTVTFVNEVFKGSDDKDAGVELYKIELGSATLSNSVKIHVLLSYDPKFPDPLTELLIGGKYIDIGVWYEDAAGSYTLSDGTKVSRDSGTKASAVMTESEGQVVLRSSLTMTDTLYVLATVRKSEGGTALDQAELCKIEFHCDLRTV